MRNRRRMLMLLAALFVTLVGVSAVVLTEGALRRQLPLQATVSIAPELELRAADGVLLEASLITPEVPNGRCAMALHGIADSRKSGFAIAGILSREGYTVLLPDSRGHGASGGNLVSYGALEAHDVALWAQSLRPKCPDGIYGYGASMGAAILLSSLAAGAPFRAVVAESPFYDFRDVARDRVAPRLRVPPVIAQPIAYGLVSTGFLYARYRYGIDLAAASPAKALQRTRIPVLLIHGLADSNINPDHSRRLAALNPAVKLWLVPDAAHTAAFATAPEAFQRRIVEWFRFH